MEQNFHLTSVPVRDKAALRSVMRAARLGLSEAERLERASAAAAHVLASPAWARAVRVGLYIAIRGEMSAKALLRAAWAEGKEALLPCCPCGQDGFMRFVSVREGDRLERGAFGIPEPPKAAGGGKECVPDLIIVPGLAFTRDGTRLGQGGGFYDRYCSRPEHADALRIGYGYAFQLLDTLPHDPWDMPMHAICTEQGMVWMTV